MLTEFQKDLQNMTLNEALIKHNLTLETAFKQLHRSLLYTRKPKKKPKPNKYIQSRDNKYYLRKQYNGKVRQYGTYHTLEDAKKIRDHCIQYGWKQKKIDEYCTLLNITRCDGPKTRTLYH